LFDSTSKPFKKDLADYIHEHSNAPSLHPGHMHIHLYQPADPLARFRAGKHTATTPPDNTYSCQGSS
jgi:hypothetical protein